MRHNSIDDFRGHGSSSLDPDAALAVRANLYFDGATGSGVWPLVMVWSRWPLRDRLGQVLVEQVVEFGL